MISFVGAVSVLYILDPYGIKANGVGPTLAARTAYNGLHRLVWAASLAWIIFASINGYAGMDG